MVRHFISKEGIIPNHIGSGGKGNDSSHLFFLCNCSSAIIKQKKAVEKYDSTHVVT